MTQPSHKASGAKIPDNCLPITLVLCFTREAQERYNEAEAIGGGYYDGEAFAVELVLCFGRLGEYWDNWGKRFVWSETFKGPREGREKAEKLCKKFGFNFRDDTK